MRLHKTYEMASFKTLDDAPGRFEAMVAVEGNVDLQGDRIVEGAFEGTIADWREKGDPIPVIWSHQWIHPEAHIGFIDPFDVEEVKFENRTDGITGGLRVKGTLDVHKPFAKQVYDLLKERRVKEWSFAYDVPAGGEGKADDGANELRELVLIEAGPALKGANPETYTIGTKYALERELENRAEVADWTERIIEHAEEVAAFLVGKAATKPWHVEERDGEYCVIKDDTDEQVSCHPTREEADAAVRALYANEADADPDAAKARTKWDGAAAMRSCSTAGDFRKIAFERANDSDPDTAAHWALPHHPSPGAEADPAGVSAALGALGGGRGGPPDLKQPVDEVRAHLEAHSSSGEATATALAEKALDFAAGERFGGKVGRVISAKSAAGLKESLGAAVDSFVAEVNGGGEEPKAEPGELPSIKARIEALTADL